MDNAKRTPPWSRHQKQTTWRFHEKQTMRTVGQKQSIGVVMATNDDADASAAVSPGRNRRAIAWAASYLVEDSHGEDRQRCIEDIIEADEIWIVQCLQALTTITDETNDTWQNNGLHANDMQLRNAFHERRYINFPVRHIHVAVTIRGFIVELVSHLR